MNVRLLSYSQPSEEFADIGVTVIAYTQWLQNLFQNRSYYVNQ